MFGYINSVRDRQYKLCTPEIFDQLVNSPMVVTHIEEYRKGNEKSKSLLPAFLFQGYNPNVLLGKKGSRLAKALQPTGFFIMDFDHVSSLTGLTPNPSPKGEGNVKGEGNMKGEGSKMTPRMVYDRFLAAMPKLGLILEDDFALAHITPSGDGLRLVLRSRKNRDVAEDQKWIADALGVECDVHVKDLSRLSFVPQASDILYINKQLLFRPLSNSLPEGRESEQVTIEDSVANETNEKIPLALQGESRRERLYPSCYNGIPYRRIVEELITVHGGTPQIGNRENTLFLIAGDMAKITDRSQTWLESLLPTFGLPEEEWRTTIAQVCKKPIERGLSRKLQEAIKRCKDEANISDSLALQGEGRGESLPPAMPERLPSLVKLLTSNVLPHQRPAVSAMIFPALAVHVNNCLFKLRDNTDVELSLMCCLLAQQSVGKGCVKPVLKQIMADIKAQDRINRERERQWQESQKNKKANEKGQSKPEDLVIRYLSSDTTPAAFLGRLFAAEHGNGTTSNLCTYSQVDEIEDLYRFCASGGKNMVQQMIKRTWDRDDIGAERFTANAANIATVLRWNWAASSTIEGGRKFFKNCLTDGTTSRVDFCTIIQPDHVIDFCYGDYDEAFERQLRPYIDRLTQFRCAKTDSGRVIPCTFPEIRAIEERMNDYINQTSSTMPDSTWENYAWRAKIMAIKKLIILYIANGCLWEDEFDDFVWWSFHYSMWCKLNLFYDAASAQFADERITGQRGNRSPLKAMRRTFTLAQLAAECQRQGCKQTVAAIVSKYKSRGVIIQNEDQTFTISPEYARKFGIA